MTAQQTIYQLIKTQAEHTPEAIALAAFGRAPLTYGDLDGHIQETIQTL
jgi:acyl-CoA synthetase (AMP-forming)/AMP-acid ligase II